MRLGLQGQSCVLCCVLAICSCSDSSSPPTPVHVGNLVEIGGTPGEARAIVALGDGPSATITLPTFPWNGMTVASVPLLPPSGTTRWRLTFHPQGAAERTVEVVDSAPTGSAGTATLQLLDEIAAIDTVIKAPPDSAQAVSYQIALSDLRMVATDMRQIIVAAQAGPVTVGSYDGQDLVLDAEGLALLDRAVLGAQEPVVTTGASGAQALTVSPQTPGAAFLLTLATAGAVIWAPTVALAVGTFSMVSIGGSLIVGNVVSQQTTNAVSQSDPEESPSVSSVADAMVWGPVRAYLNEAVEQVKFMATGKVHDGAVSCADSYPPARCNPTKCNCLTCNSIWNGCFPAGATCCGQGLWARACYQGTTCTSCNGRPTCLAPGATCGGGDAGSPDGSRDRGAPEAGHDTGLADPCGVVGPWVNECPAGSTCSGCGNSTVTITEYFTITPEIAAGGGSWSEGGIDYTFAVSGCTLTSSFPVSNACFTGTRTYSRTLADGHGSYSSAFTCFDGSTCICGGTHTCTDTKQGGM